MKRIGRKKVFFVSMSLLCLGMAGTILFFPVNINDRYTCLYHYLMVDEKDWESFESVQWKDRMQKRIQRYMNDSRRLDQYVWPFAFLWWGSIILMIPAYYLIRNNNQDETR